MTAWAMTVTIMLPQHDQREADEDLDGFEQSDLWDFPAE
jgi:hypothetical protein